MTGADDWPASRRILAGEEARRCGRGSSAVRGGELRTVRVHVTVKDVFMALPLADSRGLHESRRPSAAAPSHAARQAHRGGARRPERSAWPAGPRLRNSLPGFREVLSVVVLVV